MKFQLSTSLRHRALEDVYSQHLKEMPRPAAPDAEESVKRDLLELLNTSELVNLTTVCPSGWTATHCMHFCTVEGPGLQPIIYMSSEPHKRKVNNVRTNPRCSITCYRTLGFEQRRKSKYAQMQAVCTIIEDPEEFRFALGQMFNKKDYEFTSLIELEKATMIRADVVFSLWQDNQRRPHHCTVDYRKQIMLNINDASE